MKKYLWATINGRGHCIWFCPNCQVGNTGPLKRPENRVQCCSCKRRFIASILLRAAEVNVDAGSPAFDQVLIDDTLHPDKWRKGQPANRYIDPDPALSLPRDE